MKKEKIIDLFFIGLVIYLTCWFFWATVIKGHIEKYIDETYGNAITETRDNILILKNSKHYSNDKDGS